MALIAALLLTVVVSTAMGAIVIVAGIERRASAGYRVAIDLRAASKGILALAVQELGAADWNAALAGSGSAYWRSAPDDLDVPALTAALRAETVMGSAHGADTPLWQPFAQASWAAVAGEPGRARVAAWVADDWSEQDGDPGRDSNGLLLVRAVAVSGVAASWTEALCGRDADGRIRLRHTRSW